jgi:ABC-type polysaccharide/polyol phosphate export permease
VVEIHRQLRQRGMFQREVQKSGLQIALGILGLIFHAAVRNVRKSHGSAVVGLLLNILQSVIMVGVFYMTFELLGMRSAALRGDFLLYVMSGVFMFMTHVKALGAVAAADGPTSPLMKHSPMNTAVSIAAAALGALYLQVLSAGVILYVYHAAMNPITIHQPVETMGMLLLAWASGAALGMLVAAARPWWPEGVGIISSVYMRANMIFSGKMFVANMLPGYLLPVFDWNPLFHIVDQTRGFVFLNYTPRYTSISYVVYCTLILLLIGLMAEFYTRKYASASWGAGK